MTSTRTRRRFLTATGSGAVAALAGCTQNGSPAEPTQTRDRTTTRTGTPTDPSRATSIEEQGDGWDIDPVENETRVGAYYYPWHDPDLPRWNYVPDDPVLGEYTGREEDVINQHVKWAREHGINWFAMFYMAPGEYSDITLRDHFLPAELGREIDFSIHYSSANALEVSVRDGNRGIYLDDEGNREKLRIDFQHIEDTYFDEPNYLHVDGRPVVDIYAAHSFNGADGSIKSAFQEAKDAIDNDPYLIAAPLEKPTSILHEDWMGVFDAATTYSIYDPDIVADGGFDKLIEYAGRKSREWRLGTEHADLGFVPNVVPGYNDHLVPDRDHPILERSPDDFRELARRVRDTADPGLDAVMVTSFNEWPEYTAVEPSETFGTTYLDIIEEDLATVEPDHLDPQQYPMLQLRFNRTATPDGSDRELSMMLGSLGLEDGSGETLAEYDIGTPLSEPYIVEGAYSAVHLPDKPMGTWRWLGGPTSQTTIYLDPGFSDATTATLRGTPMLSDQIEADIYVSGEKTDHVALGDRPSGPHIYTVSLQSGT